MRYISVLTSISLSILLAIALFIYVILKKIDTPGPNEVSKIIIIENGDSANDIAKKLLEYSVIDNTYIFNISAYIEGGLRKLKAGEYIFSAYITPRQAARLIISGKVVTHSITIPEGLRSLEIINIINKHPGLKGKIKKIPLEGSLFPDTYYFTLGDTRKSIVDRMTIAMDKISNEVWKFRSVDNILKNIDEMVILASIVEKETALQGERKLIAGVFVNRLKIDMRLQSDPTVIYGLIKEGLVIDSKITKSNLKSDTPWNTYVIKGLPPTAIANPGKESLEAAVNPSDTRALYFVANGKGGHRFADNLESHNENVKKWRSYTKCVDDIECYEK